MFKLDKSVRTLTVIPIDVAVITAPTNNALVSVIVSEKPNCIVRNTPITNGKTTPPAATSDAGLAYLMN